MDFYSSVVFTILKKSGKIVFKNSLPNKESGDGKYRKSR